MNVSAWCIRNPIPSVMLFVLLSVLGLMGFEAMKVQQFPDIDLPTITVDPTDPNVVYVAALGRLWGDNEERGVYRTRDGGESWGRCDAGLPQSQAWWTVKRQCMCADGHAPVGPDHRRPALRRFRPVGHEDAAPRLQGVRRRQDDVTGGRDDPGRPRRGPAPPGEADRRPGRGGVGRL